MNAETVQLVVIGGGPAGLAAALAAWRAGLREIALIERHDELGGILRQCVHNGFGLTYFKTEMTGPEYAQTLIDQVRQTGIRVKTGTHVIELTPDRVVYAMNSQDGATAWRAKAVILAMGCRERARGAANLPGTRPAGVFTAGTVQHLINLEGLLPGREAVIVGSGDIGLIMARRLTYEGVKVRAVVEIQPFPGGLTRNIAQCLEDFNIPLYLGHRVKEIRGRDRVEGVAIENSASFESFELPSDMVVLSVGLIPEIELAAAAGAAIDGLTGGPLVDVDFQTSRPGIFACGNVLHVNDLADNASAEGETAGRAAAAFIQGKKAADRIPVVLSGELRSAVPQFLDPAVDSHVSLRVARPLREAVLLANGRAIKKLPAVLPAESLTVMLKAGTLAPDAAGRIELRLEAAAGSDADWRIEAGGGSLICIVCPIGCRLRAEKNGGAMRVEGAGCRRGVDYAQGELTEPVRILTSTVPVEDGRRRLPVRSARPIPKNLVAQALIEIRSAAARPPVRMGDVVMADLAGTGIPAVAGRDLEADSRWSGLKEENHTLE